MSSTNYFTLQIHYCNTICYCRYSLSILAGLRTIKKSSREWSSAGFEEIHISNWVCVEVCRLNLSFVYIEKFDYRTCKLKLLLTESHNAATSISLDMSWKSGSTFLSQTHICSFKYFPVTQEMRNKILTPLNLMRVLPLTSVGQGFHE